MRLRALAAVGLIGFLCACVALGRLGTIPTPPRGGVFGAVASRLYQGAPTMLPVDVRLEDPGPDMLGLTEFNGNRIIIRVSPVLDEQLQVEILVHEWAHAMAWPHETLDHDSLWGVMFSRAYRVSIGEMIGDDE